MLNVGLIGYGKWGQKLARAIDEMPEARIAGVCTRNQLAAHPFKGTEFLQTTHPEQLLDNHKIDFCVVAVPAPAQAPIIMKGLGHRMPMLVEKPLAMSIKDAYRVEQEQKQTGVPIVVDHTYLYHPAYQILRDAVRKCGGLTEMYSYAGNKGPVREWGSPLWDYGPHDVAMMIDLMGGLAPNEIEVPKQIPNLETAFAWFNLKWSNCFGSITISNKLLKRARDMMVCCQGFTLTFDDTTPKKRVQVIGRDLKSINLTPHLEDIGNLPIQNAVRALIHKMKNGDDGDSVRLGAKVVRVLAQVESELLKQQQHQPKEQ